MASPRLRFLAPLLLAALPVLGIAADARADHDCDETQWEGGDLSPRYLGALNGGFLAIWDDDSRRDAGKRGVSERWTRVARIAPDGQVTEARPLYFATFQEPVLVTGSRSYVLRDRGRYAFLDEGGSVAQVHVVSDVDGLAFDGEHYLATWSSRRVVFFTRFTEDGDMTVRSLPVAALEQDVHRLRAARTGAVTWVVWERAAGAGGPAGIFGVRISDANAVLDPQPVALGTGTLLDVVHAGDDALLIVSDAGRAARRLTAEGVVGAPGPVPATWQLSPTPTEVMVGTERATLLRIMSEAPGRKTSRIVLDRGGGGRVEVATAVRTEEPVCQAEDGCQAGPGGAGLAVGALALALRRRRAGRSRYVSRCARRAGPSAPWP